MVSFLEYLVFFAAVFCNQELENISRMEMNFDMFFGIFIFHPSEDFAWAIAFA